jgi:hypothetical protein
MKNEPYERRCPQRDPRGLGVAILVSLALWAGISAFAWWWIR